MATPAIDEGKLRALRAYAEVNPLAVEEVRAIVDGRAPVAGDRPGHSVRLPDGSRVVYSIEEHPLPDGPGTRWRRHLTMSVPTPGRLPRAEALDRAGRVLGLPPFPHCTVAEDLAAGAVEVLADRDASFTCPDCGTTSFDPIVVALRYCVGCRRYH